MTKSIPLIVALFAGSAILPANAALILSVSPASQTVSLGDQVLIDVLFSGLEDGLDEIVSGYDLTLSFDDSILAYSSGSYFDLVDFSPIPDFSINGEISWNSSSFLDDAVLQGQQGDSVTLASLTFNTLSAGTSPFNFSFDDVTGLDFTTLSYSIENGSATVGASVGSVPEPATLVLVGLGILAMTAARRRNA
ncbi:MAG: PEP-CTERM sorting domain-containing protein [Chromatiaceae bacterium]|nr:PEP-CTERM sorting domain-containing protein [Chromatiaceae bacterium]MCF8016760.1 PEP-CTERM sorting domain-containing protein [Chromatiaceae bacterium]